MSRILTSRPWRAWKRYTEARGNILAAGVGYFAFFSIFPASVLAFSVFGFVLRSHPDLLHSIFDQLGAYLPGLVQDSRHPEGLIPIQAPHAAALTISGVIAFVALVLSGLGWLSATREGIRAVFGVSGPAGNLVTDKLRDLGVLFTLGLGIAVVAVLTSGAGIAAGWIAGGLGLSGQGRVLVLLVGFAVSVLADTGLMILLLRVVSGVVAPWRDLFQGALVGGVGFSLLKISAAPLLSRVTGNPLFASFAIVVGLLFWLNLIARLTLVSAAWAANDVQAARGEPPLQAAQTPPTPPTPPTPLTPQTPGLPASQVATDSASPTLGERSGDRATLASGVLLGAVAMAATGALTRAIRSIVRLVRH